MKHIETMKLALEALENSWTEPGNKQYEFEKEAITALREALAKPDFWEGYVPEPVKPAQQEPVAWMLDGEFYKTQQFHLQGGHYANQIPLYTSPPAQRTWVGLSKEDKWEIVQATERDDRGYVMALVEARLKELNT